MTANRKAVDIANRLYSNGLGSYLNLLDAQRALYDSQDQLVRSERAVTVNLIALYKALGGGWETEKPQHRVATEAHHIDLEAYSGNDHHTLPYPSDFIAGTDGISTVAHVDRDYKARLEPVNILEALQTTRKPSKPSSNQLPVEI